MPQPTSSDVHVSVPLTTFSVAYIQGQDRYIADRVFPNISVRKQGDRYWTYDKNDFFREEVSLRAPGTESTGSGFRVDNTPTYYCNVYATHKDIDDQVRANAVAPGTLRTGANTKAVPSATPMVDLESVVQAVRFLAGADARQVTGQVIELAP